MTDLEAIPARVLEEVARSYRSRNLKAQEKLDQMAEQFPEFVLDLQEQLGRRLVLLAELWTITSQESAGTIPSSVAEHLASDLREEISELHHHIIPKLRTPPEELLRTVPFLRNLNPEDFSVLGNRMRSRTVSAGQIIFEQGDSGFSLFLIARGVLRVSRKEGDEWRHLATLMAGNFFGEAAFLERQPRNATITAITPGSLYELIRNDLETVLDVYPGVRKALEEENKRRKLVDRFSPGNEESTLADSTP